MSTVVTLFEYPIPGRVYSSGIDVASGLGESKTVMEILDNETGHHVASLISDDSPVFAAHWSCHFSGFFNMALMVIEINGPGIFFFDCCESAGYSNLFYEHIVPDRPRKGLWIRMSNKDRLIGNLESALKSRSLIPNTWNKYDKDEYWAMAFANYGKGF